MEYYRAGADVATTNNFAATEFSLSRALGDASGVQELTRVLPQPLHQPNCTDSHCAEPMRAQAAVAVAQRARTAAVAACPRRRLLVAGSLPPLRESYEPLTTQQAGDAGRQYAEIAGALAEADVLLCETMASVLEV